MAADVIQEPRTRDTIAVRNRKILKVSNDAVADDRWSLLNFLFEARKRLQKFLRQLDARQSLVLTILDLFCCELPFSTDTVAESHDRVCSITR